jgi:hypothetical protein
MSEKNLANKKRSTFAATEKTMMIYIFDKCIFQ